MLSEIIEHAVASDPDIAIVEDAPVEADDLDGFSRAKRIDVIIFPATAAEFSDERIGRLLHANPRLGLLAMDGAADRGDLHHVVRTCDGIGRLTQPNLVAAIRAGAQMRRL